MREPIGPEGAGAGRGGAEGEPRRGAAGAGRSATRRGRRHRRWLVGGLTVAVVAAGGGVAAASALPGGSAYRTGVVTEGATTEAVNASGTLLPANEAVLNFPVSGVVATVGVQLGEHVKAGQLLARLSDSGLEAAETVDQAVLTEDESRLSADEAAEVSGAVTAGTTTATSASGSGTTASPSSTSGGSTDHAATGAAANPTSGHSAALEGMLAGLSALQAQLREAEDAAVAAREACAVSPASGETPKTTTSTTTGTAPPSRGGAGHRGSPAGATPSSGTGDACVVALGRSLAAQGSVLQAEERLASELAGVARATGTGSASPSAAASSPGDSGASRASAATGASSGGSGSGGTTRTGGSQGLTGAGGPGASVVTPAIVDQQRASVDAAEVALLDAERELSGSELSSPISGTVAVVGIAPGQAVSSGVSSLEAGSEASSSTLGSGAALVVVGVGGMVASTSVPAGSISSVHVGQEAVVKPAGGGAVLRGRVSTVGLLPASGTTGTTYTVTIQLDSATGLRPGSGVSASIVVARVDRGIVVPTSAVHLLGSRALVDVLAKGKVVATVVTIGATGPIYTEVTSGLRVGERVVLARLDEALPTTTSGTGAGALAGGFGGFRAGAGRALAGGARRGGAG